MSAALDRFLAGLERRDAEVVVLLVEEEAAAHGVRDVAAPEAAAVVAAALRATCARLAVELDAERDDAPLDDDEGWDRPAVPYHDDDLAAIADAAVADSPALDALLGRFLERLPARRRRGVLRRARRVWERAGVRDPDVVEARATVRAALLHEALQEGFVPPPRVVREAAPLDAPPPEPPAALADRLAPGSAEARATIEEAVARLGAQAVRETLDQAAFLALRGGLSPALRETWVARALAARRPG